MDSAAGAPHQRAKPAGAAVQTHSDSSRSLLPPQKVLAQRFSPAPTVCCPSGCARHFTRSCMAGKCHVWLAGRQSGEVRRDVTLMSLSERADCTSRNVTNEPPVACNNQQPRSTWQSATETARGRVVWVTLGQVQRARGVGQELCAAYEGGGLDHFAPGVSER